MPKKLSFVMKTMKLISTLAALSAIFALASCSKEDKKEPVPAPKITEFSFLASNNQGVLGEDYTCTISGTDISVSMPSTVDKSALVASFTTNTGDIVKVGKLVQKSGTTPNDFSVPLDYTISNSDSTLNAVYTVTISKKSDSNWTSFVPYTGVSTVYSGAIMAINPKDNVPYLAFKVRADSVTTANANMLDVKKLANGAWESVGKDAFAPATGSELDLDFLSNGTPYVAFQNSTATANKCASVMSFDGSSWNFAGDAAISSDMTSTYVNFAALSASDIVLAQVNNKAGSFPRRVMVMSSFNGSAWSNAQNSLIASDAFVYSENMAKAGDAAYLALIYRTAPYKHVVLKYQSGKWSAIRTDFVQDKATQTGISVLEMAPLADGTVYLLTSDDAVTTGSYQLRLEKYSPSTSSWSTVGGNPLPYIIESHNYAKVAVAPDGTPYIAYQNYASKQIEICHLDSETKQWSAPTVISPLVGDSCTSISLCFTSTGIGYLGYIDGNNHYQVYQYK